MTTDLRPAGGDLPQVRADAAGAAGATTSAAPVSEASATGTGASPPAAAALLRLQRILLALIVIVCAGTIVELILAGHFEDWLQWVPFALAGLGGAAAWAVYTRPTPARVRLLRGAMVAAVLVGIIGCGVHAVGNYLFAQETDPTASFGALLLEAVTGADPLLAPGVLVLVGVLGWLASEGIGSESASIPDASRHEAA